MKYVKLVDDLTKEEIAKIPFRDWHDAIFKNNYLITRSNGEVAAKILNRPELEFMLLDAIIIEK